MIVFEFLSSSLWQLNIFAKIENNYRTSFRRISATKSISIELIDNIIKRTKINIIEIRHSFLCMPEEHRAHSYTAQFVQAHASLKLVFATPNQRKAII